MPELIDLVGKKFGHWTVLSKGATINSAIYWLCKCDCGTEREVRGHTLRRGENNSCGCERNKMISAAQLNDLTGKKFGLLTAIERSKNNAKTRKPNWLCKCDCGSEKVVSSNALLNNKTKSCGCQQYKIGQEHKRWKGGRLIDEKGYVLVYAPDSPMARGRTYVYEHRLTMAKKLGRDLFKNENVHHINGNRQDNRIENLELWVSSQPPGQRVEDLVKFAKHILKTYEHLLSK